MSVRPSIKCISTTPFNNGVRQPLRATMSTLLAILACVGACGENTDEQSSQLKAPLDVPEAGKSATQGNEPPKPTKEAVLVATIKFKTGNTVEFYDFGRAVLISETGAAYSEQEMKRAKLEGDLSQHRLADIWSALDPVSPFPDALAQLQTRLDNLGPPEEYPVHPNKVDVGGGGVENAEGIGVKTQALEGCNNGCCDYAWLSTFGQCQGGSDYSWFLFNYGWTYSNINDIIIYGGMVCSASGTSTFSYNVNGYGGTFPVPQATYRTAAWFAAWRPWCGGACGENLSSSVNSSSNSHLHTYCGYIVYD